jgi:hypothetical protein
MAFISIKHKQALTLSYHIVVKHEPVPLPVDSDRE